MSHLDELAKCYRSPSYFINKYVKVFDANSGDWIPFHLWAAQESTLQEITLNLLILVLKARQLGLTWLVLAYALWLMLFRPIAEIGLFSRREKEAVYLLSEDRLRGMFQRLPDWMRDGYEYEAESATIWKLNNGSTARAFPTSAGDSYTFTLAIIDEADLAPDLQKLMLGVKPTIDAGNQMILVGRSDKSKPMSYFKRIYKKAKVGKNAWKHVFLPWDARPDRTRKWYESIKADIFQNTGALDDLHEQYPSTDTEALQARTLDKRIPYDFLARCYEEMDGLMLEEESIPGLIIYAEPEPEGVYVISGDPAEGNPNSDDSACDVLNVMTGEQMATFAGRIEPTVFASYINQLGVYYNKAAAMIERNNHGHTVIAWLVDYSDLPLLEGHDVGKGKRKIGWLSSSKGKALMYNEVTDSLRDEEVILHSFETFTQLASIEGGTLLAPDGEKDDKADSLTLAVVGANRVSNNWLLG